MKLFLLIVIVIGAVTLLIVCGQKPETRSTGTYCVDVASDYQRIQEAYGHILNLPGPATPAQMEAAIFNWLEQSTGDYERRKDMSAFTPPPFTEHKKYNPSASPSPTKK